MSKELEELQEIARKATQAALQNYTIPEDWLEELILGIMLEGDDRIFELYVASERPEDAILISSARVDRKTKSVEVLITNLARHS